MSFLVVHAIFFDLFLTAFIESVLTNWPANKTRCKFKRLIVSVLTFIGSLIGIAISDRTFKEFRLFLAAFAMNNYTVENPIIITAVLLGE